MVGRVGHALTDLGGDVLDRSFSLRQQFDDLGPPSAGECFRDFGKPVVESVLLGPVTHADHFEAHKT